MKIPKIDIKIKKQKGFAFVLTLEDGDTDYYLDLEGDDINSLIDDAVKRLVEDRAPIEELYGQITLDQSCLELECSVLNKNVTFLADDSNDNMVVVPYETLAKEIKNHKKYKIDISSIELERLEQEMAEEKNSVEWKTERIKELEEEIAEIKSKKLKKAKHK